MKFLKLENIIGIIIIILLIINLLNGGNNQQHNIDDSYTEIINNLKSEMNKLSDKIDSLKSKKEIITNNKVIIKEKILSESIEVKIDTLKSVVGDLNMVKCGDTTILSLSESNIDSINVLYIDNIFNKKLLDNCENTLTLEEKQLSLKDSLLDVKDDKIINLNDIIVEKDKKIKKHKFINKVLVVISSAIGLKLLLSK